MMSSVAAQDSSSRSGRFRIIVAHPGRQHSFRLAAALKRRGLLHSYVTTVYRKTASPLMSLVERFVTTDNADRSRRRRSEALDDSEVVQRCEMLGLLELLWRRLLPRTRFTAWWAERTSVRFQRLVARRAIRGAVDAVVMYDANAADCFRILKRDAPQVTRILDVSAANRLYVKHLYEEDMLRSPRFAERLRSERPVLFNADLRRFHSELQDADLVLCPSEFVMRSVEFSGVPGERLALCPYGSNFDVTERVWSKDYGTLRLLYVGTVTQMKGISYLLDAVKAFPECAVSLTVVGEFDNAGGLFDEYVERVDFLGRQPHAEVRRIALESDVFIVPSLAEGMSLAGLEALACGLPLVCSANSGVNDLVEDGGNGFVVPVGDEPAIREKIEWFLNHRSMIPVMGVAAQRTAAEYTWDRYEEAVADAIEASLSRASSTGRQ